MNGGLLSSRSVMIYEPRVEGHHLVWLKFVVEDLLSDGWKLTLALDGRPESAERIRERLGALLQNVTVQPAGGKSGGARAVAEGFSRAGTSLAFLDSFDEIASSLLRRAAFGQMPPITLRGRMGGIYLRPRFLARRGFSLNAWLKALGFARLMKGGWLTHLLFLDPWLQARCERQHPEVPVFSLPDPCPDDFICDGRMARRHFEIPAGRKVLLFYGAAYRRKGLHLAVEALLGLPRETPAFLLCAGQQSDDAAVQSGLKRLVAEGRARVITRYIYQEEEKLLFNASDIVLLPYIKHFGNSAVLSRAAGAGKMVIASDEELVGRLVREHELGLLFSSANVPALRGAIEEALRAPAAARAQWRAAASRYAALASRAEFRRILRLSFERAIAGKQGRQP